MSSITVQQPINTSPLEALMAHFASSSKSVQRAFAKYIIDSNAKEVATRRQQMMMKESLSQAFKELSEGNARPVEELLSEL